MLTVYEPTSDYNRSDQVTVPADVWTALDREHEGAGPMFVNVGDGVFGRLRPAVPSDGLSGDSCRVPEWMFRRLGWNNRMDEEAWIGLTVCDLPPATTMILRARREADLTESDEPVAMLTAALSGSAVGGLSWSCLTVGSELPLACGVFDVMGLLGADGEEVPAACILDCDVNLELVPALDRPPTPPVPEPEEPEEPEPLPTPTKGFVAFSGVGRRLGS